VDIPVHPHHFHLSLVEHFASTLGLYRQAGKLYDEAFAIQAGKSEAYCQAAFVWRQAGDPGKAEIYRQRAAAAKQAHLERTCNHRETGRVPDARPA
jgi:hypothetical protein